MLHVTPQVRDGVFRGVVTSDKYGKKTKKKTGRGAGGAYRGRDGGAGAP